MTQFNKKKYRIIFSFSNEKLKSMLKRSLQIVVL